MCHREVFCGILVKNVADFCPYLKSMPKSKVMVKRIRLITLTKEVSEKSLHRFCSLVYSHEKNFDQV